MNGNEIWRFETASFVVRCLVHEEDMNPADSFEDSEAIEDIREGRCDWFRVEMRVETKNGNLLGSDHLGGCAYRNASDFAKSPDRDGYFRDMVYEAIRDARNYLDRLPHLNVR
jgi:hypothetical protein